MQRQDRAAVIREGLHARAAGWRDELWAAMHRGRSMRALEAVKPRRQGLHRIWANDHLGYVSVAEIACQHAEREACSRAIRACKSFDAVASAVRVLEEGLNTADRVRQVAKAWRENRPNNGNPQGAFSAPEDPQEDPEGDAFAAAFGDWAPAWMSSESVAA